MTPTSPVIPVDDCKFPDTLWVDLCRDAHRVRYVRPDSVRYPRQAGLAGVASEVRGYLRAWASDLWLKLGGQRAGSAAVVVGDRLGEVSKHAADLGRLYGRLADSASRRLLLDVLRYRVFGSRRVALPLAQNGRYHRAAWTAARLIRQPRTDPAPPPLDWLDLYDLITVGFPVQMHVHRLHVMCTFLLEQYRCPRHGLPDIAPPIGGVVLDGGGCYGDSALYFAHAVGASGRVIAFEFDPANLAVFDRNLTLNPALADRVAVVRRPVWHTPGMPVVAAGVGPATSVEPARGRATAYTTTIDETITALGGDQVDFIKLDVEGAELAALRGAEATLRRFRPTVAVAVYHRLRDFWEVADYLDGLAIGYRFHLGHYTTHAEETILFAEAREPVPADCRA